METRKEILMRLWLLTFLAICSMVDLSLRALGQGSQLGTPPLTPTTKSTSGTMTLVFHWHWDASYPGNVEVIGAVPPTTDAVVTGVRMPTTPTGSNISVEDIEIIRGSSIPVTIFPGVGYTELFNSFSATGARWFALATVTAVDSSSLLNMTINIDWNVPQPAPPPPPPAPKPLQMHCSQPSFVHLTYGEGYDNTCLWEGGSNSSVNWSTPKGVPPGLSLVNNFTVAGRPAGGTYSYVMRVANTAHEAVEETFTITVDPPHEETTTDGITSLLVSLMQE